MNNCGEIVSNVWNEIPEHFKYVSLDEYMSMPSHLHGIIIIDNIDSGCRDTACRVRVKESFGKPIQGSLATVIRSFKSEVSRSINQMRHTPGCRIWQSNYYEHIIRNEKSMNEIRKYIINNPIKWEYDKYNPDC